jgi:hypothetical protein
MYCIHIQDLPSIYQNRQNMKPRKGSPILTTHRKLLCGLDSSDSTWRLCCNPDNMEAALLTSLDNDLTSKLPMLPCCWQGTLANAAASFDGTACSRRYVLEQWGSQRQCAVFTSMLWSISRYQPIAGQCGPGGWDVTVAFQLQWTSTINEK